MCRQRPTHGGNASAPAGVRHSEAAQRPCRLPWHSGALWLRHEEGRDLDGIPTPRELPHTQRRSKAHQVCRRLHARAHSRRVASKALEHRLKAPPSCAELVHRPTSPQFSPGKACFEAELEHRSRQGT